MGSKRFWLWDEIVSFLLKPMSLVALFILVINTVFSANLPDAGHALFNLSFGLEADDPAKRSVFWILNAFPPMLLSGMYMQQELSRGVYGIIRMRSYQSWWMRKWLGMAGGVLVYWASYMALIILVNVAGGGALRFPASLLDNTVTIPVWLYPMNLAALYINSLLFCTCVLALQAGTGDQKTALLVPFLIYGVTVFSTMIFNDASMYLPGSWSMLKRCSLIKFRPFAGFNLWAVLAVQAAAIIFLTLWIPGRLRRHEMANKKQL